MKKFVIALALMLLAGCQQVPADKPEDRADFLPQIRVSAPIAVFATYPSPEMAALCEKLAVDANACVDDALNGNLFVKHLMDVQWFSEVLPASEHTDYELLIASQSVEIATKDDTKEDESLFGSGLFQDDTQLHYLTELTVQWRGVEIASHRFNTVADEDTTDEEAVKEILNNWWLKAIQNDVFAAHTLFETLGASDYLTNMQVPDTIGAFRRQDTQLYPDPLKGVITRYRHPEYENAVLDIAVAPILSDLSNSDEQILKMALQSVVDDASAIAKKQSLSLDISHPISRFQVDGMVPSARGYRVAVVAESQFNEPIFASTYAFRQQDKVVTLSTTFPPRVSDELVALALPYITVPGESSLMKTLRKISHQAGKNKPPNN